MFNLNEHATLYWIFFVLLPTHAWLPPVPLVTTQFLNMSPVANRTCLCKASKTHPGFLLATGLVSDILE